MGRLVELVTPLNETLPPTIAPLRRLWVLGLTDAMTREAALATLNRPACVPPPSSESVPACTVTLLLLLNKPARVRVPSPALFRKSPALLNVQEPARAPLVWTSKMEPARLLTSAPPSAANPRPNQPTVPALSNRRPASRGGSLGPGLMLRVAPPLMRVTPGPNIRPAVQSIWLCTLSCPPPCKAPPFNPTKVDTVRTALETRLSVCAPPGVPRMSEPMAVEFVSETV